MLLTETIKKSTTAIKKHRAATESKQHAEAYGRALAQLAKTTDDIRGTLDRAAAMRECGIVDTPLMDRATRNELLACIDDCGNGVNEITLSPEAVRLLASKGDTVAAQVKLIWKDASKQYSEDTRGYLITIADLSADPARAKELASDMAKLTADDPTVSGIRRLVSDVAEAKQIVAGFSLDPQIEKFLKKVSARQATVADLTPHIMDWLRQKGLTGKLGIRFG